jgi:hypothetical protein
MYFASGSRIISITCPKRCLATSSAALPSTEAKTLYIDLLAPIHRQFQQAHGVTCRGGIEYHYRSQSACEA